MTALDPSLAVRPPALKARPSLSRLGFGGAGLGGSGQAVSDAEAERILEAAWGAGVRYFDTAPYYGFGLSERRIGDFLRSKPRGSYVLSTKVGRRLRPWSGDVSGPRCGFHTEMPFEPVYDYGRDGVMRSFEDSLQRLGLDRVDILLAHDLGALTHGPEHEARMREFLDGGCRALDELRAQGVVGAVGLGVNETAVCEQAMRHARFDCFLLAGRYTLLEQAALDGFLPMCAEHGAEVVIGGPYNSGILAAGSRGGARATYDYAAAPADLLRRVEAIEAVCDAFGVALPAAALQFVLAHPAIASVVPGATEAGHVSFAAEALGAPIPDAFWARLKAEGLLRDDAPVPTLDTHSNPGEARRV